MDREGLQAARQAARAARQSQPRSPVRGAMFGLIIISVGVALLLNNLGIVHFRDIWDFAPLVLVAVGLMQVADAAGRPIGSIFGALLIGFGSLWFAGNMDWFHIDGRLIGPLIVISFGVLFLARAIDRQRWIPAATAAADGPAPGTPAGLDPGSFLNDWTLFGGIKRNITSQQFQGGEVFVAFGGADIDLRRAALAGEEVIIHANATFGGIELKAPTTWTVVVRGQGIFGGYEDKTLPASNAELRPQRLIVSGVAMFGGVVVQN